MLPQDEFGKFYISGNYMDALSLSEEKRANYDWAGVIYDNGGSRSLVELAEPCDMAEVTTHTAEEAYNKVLEYAGASLYRDAVDARYAEEVRTRTATYKGSVSNLAGILDVNADFGGFPELPAGTPIVDSDNDGMPDDWELLNGLNPNDASDAVSYSLDPRGWYTNVELYANSLVEDIMKNGNKDAVSGVDEYYPVVKNSGIDDVEVSGDIENVEYYDIRGVRVEEPVKGISIRRTIYTSGRIVTDKVVR